MASLLVTSSAALSARQWMGRYELVSPLARGGMAEVWLAKLHGQHGFEKLVALKTILPTFARDPRFRSMFVAEAKISARIRHVNVAHVLDLGEHDGRLYFAMEWVNGESLHELERAATRRAEVISPSLVLRVIADVCAGLHAAHELRDARGKPLNVVHRDVSPHNILISAEGVVTLIDFGVMKALGRGIEDTSTGTVKGKVQYMAPEQALGRVLDRRADIWAVGATLYRLLAGRPVFRCSNPSATFKRLISPAPPDPLPSSVPAALSSVVLKALAFDPTDRYATAAELGAALEALLRGPDQATSRDVADCVERYLGSSLSARRAVLDRALLAVAEPAVLELDASQETTRPLGGKLASTPRPRRAHRGRKMVTTSSLLAMGGVVVWALFSSGSRPASPALPAPPTVAASQPPIDATISMERAPPVAPQELPLLPHGFSASEPSPVIRPRDPTPKREVKRATRMSALPKPPTRKGVASPRSDAVAKVTSQVVDDGF